MILRDDFDSENFNDLWSESSEGVQVGETCGELSHGQAAVFCGKSSGRELISRTLSFEHATSLQFRLGKTYTSILRLALCK